MFQQLRRPNAYCPTYLKELEEARASAKVQTLLKENKKLLTYITRNAGKPINTLDDVFGIYQTLCAEKSLNLTIPDWAVKVYDDIETLSGKLCELENSNDVLKKLNGGNAKIKYHNFSIT